MAGQETSSFASKEVNIPFMKMVVGSIILLGAGFVGLTTCSGNSVPQACVDYHDLVVEDAKCVAQPTPIPGTSASQYPYRWHYGGSHYSFGHYPVGGSYSPPASASSFFRPNSHGSSFSGSGGVTRGIFGGSGFSIGG